MPEFSIENLLLQPNAAHEEIFIKAQSTKKHKIFDFYSLTINTNESYI